MKFWLAFLFIFSISSRLGATIIRVPSEYPTIQEGINAANYGDTVLVAPGTYPEYDIIMKDGVYLKSEKGAENTIIDPDTLGRDHRIFNCDSLTKTTIDGFTICNGETPYYGGYGGGGILSRASHIVIKNNIIRNNFSYFYSYTSLIGTRGGGIEVCGGFCVIEDNVIADNVVIADWLRTYSGSYSAGLGGGICIRNARAVINTNIIENNWGGYHTSAGGGIYCEGDSEVVIINNIIANNYVIRGDGGGIYCKAPAMITNNTIVYNRATPIIVQDTLRWGGGIFCASNSIVIKDNIIAFNGAEVGGGTFCSESAQVLITYNDFFYNVGGDFYNPPYGVGNFTWGYNREYFPCDSFYNINVDPMFTGGPEGDYYSTTCIDCGSFRVERGFELRTTTPDGKPDTGWVDLGYHYGTAPIIITGIEEEFSQPTFSSNPYLLKCYPNPFSSKFNIEFKLPLATHVKISIYDISGKRLATVVDRVCQSGFVTWNSQIELGKSLANGIYFVCLQTQNYTKTEKIVSLK